MGLLILYRAFRRELAIRTVKRYVFRQSGHRISRAQVIASYGRWRDRNPKIDNQQEKE